MTAFIQLLSSGANAILTLEGQNTTCADVFYAWVCIAFHLEQVLASPSIGVAHHRGQVIAIYNHRFNQMMSESSHNVFLLSYFLHPCESLICAAACVGLNMLSVFYQMGGLQLTMPALDEGEKLRKEQYPRLFKTLLSSLLNIFNGEQIRLQDSGEEAVPHLIQEFIAYAYHREPFRIPFTRDIKPLKWWTNVSKDSSARLLGVSLHLLAILKWSNTHLESCGQDFFNLPFRDMR